ncbi:CopD family protein [Sphingomonas sp. PvP056]|uniref:CopD family protein n=1 Tax=Sphingomonas sp. PvP056 TaxID=3156392 RepID=UPI003396258B
MDYLWLKAAHVAAVLTFTSGLLVQAFGVAVAARGGTEALDLISRWDRRVTAPAMVTAWLTGAVVASQGAWFSFHWLWVKLGIAVFLSGLHGMQSGRLRRLRWGDRSNETSPFLIPALIAFSVTAIAILAVAKPR